MPRRKPAQPDSPAGPEVEVQDPEVVETPEVAEAEEAEPTATAPEATSTVTLKGPASAVQRAAQRLGTHRPPPPPPRNGDQDGDDDYDDQIGELMADGRNRVVVTRSSPKRFKGMKVRPIRVEFDCPVTIEQIEGELFEGYGGKVFRIAIYPNTPTAETKQPLGAFTLTNTETDEPWEPEDLEEEPQDPASASGDPYSKTDRSPGGTAKRMLEEEAEHLANEISVKRLRKTLKQVEGDEDEDREPEKTPADERVRQLEEKLAMRDIEARMDKKLDDLKALIVANHQPKTPEKDPIVEMMKATITVMQESNKQQTELMKSFFSASNSKKEDPFESLEKIARLKTLFGGDNERINELTTLAIERMLDGDDRKGDAADDSDIKYAINKMEPLFQKLVDRGISDTGKTKDQLTAEQIRAIQIEAAQKAAKELEQKWVAEGLLVKAPALPAPGQGAPQPQTKEQQGGRESMTIPPAPGEPNYDRKKAVDFVLDVAIHDIKNGCPNNSFLVWDIVDGLDPELLEQFSKVENGTQLDAILSAWGDPAKIAEVKRLGQDQAPKTWISRVVTTAQDIILKKKAGTLK